MTWNYRIVKYLDDQGFGLHEVYYDADGLPWAMTAKPCSFSCDTDEGPSVIIDMMAKAMADAQNRPVFDEPDKWPGKAPSRD
jgi:hypothetical protein